MFNAAKSSSARYLAMHSASALSGGGVGSSIAGGT
jgi:hypothetical protein